MKKTLLLLLLSISCGTLYANEPSTGTLIQISGLGIFLVLILSGTLFQGILRDVIVRPFISLFSKKH